MIGGHWTINQSIHVNAPRFDPCGVLYQKHSCHQKCLGPDLNLVPHTGNNRKFDHHTQILVFVDIQLHSIHHALTFSSLTVTALHTSSGIAT